MKVEIFYDISCTWCRVAKANLHKVVDELVAAGKLKEDEVAEARWCSPEEAGQLIRKNTTAEFFLNNAIRELKRKI